MRSCDLMDVVGFRWWAGLMGARAQGASQATAQEFDAQFRSYDGHDAEGKTGYTCIFQDHMVFRSSSLMVPPESSPRANFSLSHGNNGFFLYWQVGTKLHWYGCICY